MEKRIFTGRQGFSIHLVETDENVLYSVEEYREHPSPSESDFNLVRSGELRHYGLLGLLYEDLELCRRKRKR